MAASSSMVVDPLLEYLRLGSEFTLHSLTADYSTVHSRRVFLFLRDQPPPTNPALYGKAGTLYWTLIPPTCPTLQHFLTSPAARHELDTQRLPLHTLTDLRSAKQTDTLRHPSLARIPDTTCFALSSSLGLEMNLTALTPEDKDRWWNGIMNKLKSGRKQLKITSSTQQQQQQLNSASQSPSPALIIRGPTPSSFSSAPSPSNQAAGPPPAPPLSPTSLRRILLAGDFFNKFDLDPHGHVTCTSIFLWAEGVGKQGDLYWVEAKPHPGFVPPPSNILPPSHSLALGRITDFMLKKKSAALKASSAPDACCFALVASDKSTLNLECESKEVCKNWRDGLINMLLTAGKQVVRADAPTPTHAMAAVAAAAPAPAPVAALPSPSHVRRSASEERELLTLTTGAVFTLYYTNSKHAPEQAKITLFFVDLAPPSDPGALCWCGVGSKRMIEGQRLMLNTMKQMIIGCEHPSFRHAIGDLDLDPDTCFTIVGKSLILNLEASNPAIREAWLKGLHSIMTRFQQEATRKKAMAQDMAAKAAKEIFASNEGQFVAPPPMPSLSPTPPSPTPGLSRTPSPSPFNPTPTHSPSASISSLSAASFDDQLTRLRRGDVFTLYTASPVSPIDVQSHSIFLFYVDDSAGPGFLYYCAPPPVPRQLLDHQRFSLASLTKMVGGKDTAIFQNDKMRLVPVDRCLSIIGKHSMLNVEAKGVEVRDLWIKTLHAVMTRFKPAKAGAGGGGGGGLNGVMPVGLGVLSGGPSPMGSAPPSPSSTTTSNPLFNPSAPPSPQPLSHSLSAPIPPVSAASPHSPFPLSSAAVSSLSQEPEAVYLSTPHTFKMYSASPVGYPSIVDVSIFFQPLPHTSPDAPGALFWVPVGAKRETKDSQKLPLNRIQQMAGGKDTPIFKHIAAAAVPKERCMYLTSAAVTWSLEAASVELKTVWMQHVHTLLTKMGRQRIEDGAGGGGGAKGKLERANSVPTPREENGGDRTPTPPANGHQHPLPLPPTPAPPTPAAAAAAAVGAASATAAAATATPLSKSTVDIKTALQTVQAGQVFTLYHFSPGGEPTAERLFFFFQPSTGADQPGVLCWSHPDHPHEVDPKRRFVLNTIKQMRAGKDTPILKSSIAAKARSSHCLSLSSSALTLNLEAPSADIAELWRKSLHTVLVRHGMKAVEDQPAAGAASAAAPTPSSAAASAAAVMAIPPGAARPLNSAVATHINRTINFMDPTEFFSLKAKIGEGSYGAVYKAIDHRDGQAVAIKIIPFSGKDSLKLRKEIRTLRQCHSPFIVGYKGAFHKLENVWIVMEYAAAGSLSDMMQICKRTLSEVQISAVMKQTLAGLAYLHGQGKIHRDIKGGNILSDANGMMKLADFGVSGNLDKVSATHFTSPHTPSISAATHQSSCAFSLSLSDAGQAPDGHRDTSLDGSRGADVGRLQRAGRHLVPRHHRIRAGHRRATPR